MRALPRPRGHMNRGFSLLELLVVMAVVVALISILVPVLGRVRVAAERTQCTSNQRQIYHGIVGYIAQYDQYPIHRREVPMLLCPSRDVTTDTMRKYVIWPVVYARPIQVASDDHMRQNVRALVERADPSRLHAVEDIRTSAEIRGVLTFPHGERNHHAVAFWDGSVRCWPSYRRFRASERGGTRGIP